MRYCGIFEWLVGLQGREYEQCLHVSPSCREEDEEGGAGEGRREHEKKESDKDKEDFKKGKRRSTGVVCFLLPILSFSSLALNLPIAHPSTHACPPISTYVYPSLPP